jgi:AraC family transcriptional regulator
MEVTIKNMVCSRCIKIVSGIFRQAGVDVKAVRLGSVETIDPINSEQKDIIRKHLVDEGFEILDNQKQKLIERSKNLLIEKIQTGEIEEHFIVSDFLEKRLNKEYTYLSRLFSEVEGITIEQFFILQKIEKVKEWIAYDELTLSEIAWKLGYSSVAHLSSQFKKITGLTPSHFKKLGVNHRKSLDTI